MTHVLVYEGGPLCSIEREDQHSIVACRYIYQHCLENFDNQIAKLKFFEALHNRQYDTALLIFNENEMTGYPMEVVGLPHVRDEPALPPDIVNDIPNQIAALLEPAQQEADADAAFFAEQAIQEQAAGITAESSQPPPSPFDLPFDGAEETQG